MLLDRHGVRIISVRTPCLRHNAQEWGMQTRRGIGTKVLSEAVNTANSVAGMLSSLGRCHTFDQRADGYCRGEGCSAFLLQSTTATGINILGSAVQQDGPSASLTAPNGLSQTRLIESVQCGSKGNSSLEAHGTGTALGDPIEVCH